MTLDQLFAIREAEAKARFAAEVAYRLTPQGKAEYEARQAYHRRMAEADARAWEARTPHQKGADAACSGEDREPPDDMGDADRAEWLAGFDAQQPDEDDA